MNLGKINILTANSIQPLLQEFSAHESDIIQRGLNLEQFDGVIPASIVIDLNAMSEEPSSSAELMLKFLPLASHYARPITSNFRVGAVAQGVSGAFYLGSNLEIENENLGNSIHAEQSAINNTLLHNEHGITHLAVTASPCGHCRQFLNEIEYADQLKINILGNEPTNLKTLLPNSFKPVDLGNTSPLFIANKTRSIPTHKTDFEFSDSHSYAPYTHSPSAVSLKVSQGIDVVGVYIESAAYNPSLSPLLSALDQLRYRVSDFSCIEQVTLFESINAQISQLTHVKSLLKVIAPNARLTTISDAFKQT